MKKKWEGCGFLTSRWVHVSVFSVKICQILCWVHSFLYVQGWVHFQKRLFARHSVIRNRWKLIKKRGKTRRVDFRHFWLNFSSESKVITKKANFYDLKKGIFLISCLAGNKLTSGEKKNRFSKVDNFRFRREIQLKMTESLLIKFSSILENGMSLKKSFLKCTCGTCQPCTW